MKKLIQKLSMTFAALALLLSGNILPMFAAETTANQEETTEVQEAETKAPESGETEAEAEADPVAAADQAILLEIVAAVDAMIGVGEDPDILPEFTFADLDALQEKANTITDEQLRKDATAMIEERRAEIAFRDSKENVEFKAIYAESKAMFNADGSLKAEVTSATLNGLVARLNALKTTALGEFVLNKKSTQLNDIIEHFMHAEVLLVEKNDPAAKVVLNPETKSFISGKDVTMTVDEATAFLAMNGAEQAEALSLNAGTYDMGKIIYSSKPSFTITTNSAMNTIGTHTITIKENPASRSLALVSGDVTLSIQLTTTANPAPAAPAPAGNNNKLANTGEAVAEQLVGGSALFGFAALLLLKRKF